mmetsp:Transcript_4451/g.7803  ORF Transcript_4451/g.7803 Transcript_4451/m.7803 type:complete len:226 (-) Transcript_4451:630-1307(-)
MSTPATGTKDDRKTHVLMNHTPGICRIKSPRVVSAVLTTAIKLCASKDFPKTPTNSARGGATSLYTALRELLWSDSILRLTLGRSHMIRKENRRLTMNLITIFVVALRRVVASRAAFKTLPRKAFWRIWASLCARCSFLHETSALDREIRCDTIVSVASSFPWRGGNELGILSSTSRVFSVIDPSGDPGSMLRMTKYSSFSNNSSPIVERRLSVTTTYGFDDCND